MIPIRPVRAGSIALVALVALWLYWPARHLPLIYDTLLHIRIAGDLDWRSVWLPTEAFGFFRPLTFVPFLIVESFFGRYPPLLLNLLNSGQHALNAALLAALVLRLGGRLTHAIATGLIFATFPFSFQAVAVYGHNVHPAIVGLLLLALHSALSARRGRWLLVALLFVVAVLTHESAVLLGPFLVLTGLLSAPAWRDWLRAALPGLIVTGAGVAWLLLYRLLPITRAPQAVAESADVPARLLYLLQGAAWPFAALLRRLVPDWSAQTLILLAVLLTFALLTLAARHGCPVWYGGRWLLVGAGWWGLAAALLFFSLPGNYLLNGPRLLYLGSVGLALAWGTLPGVATGRWRRPALLLTALIVTGNILFVRQRLAAYDRLTSGLALVAAQERDDGLLLVNWPQWIAPPANTFPLGGEFVAQLGDYLFVEEWVGFNLPGENRPIRALRVDGLLAATPYGYGVHSQWGSGPFSADWAGRPVTLLITRYTPDGPVAQATGRWLPQHPAEVLATTSLWTLHAATARWCAGTVRVETVWSAQEGRMIPGTASLFVQLLDGDGVLTGQQDGPPLQLPTGIVALPRGWAMADWRDISADSPPATVLVGAYDYATGERHPAWRHDHTPWPDAAIRVPVTAGCEQR